MKKTTIVYIGNGYRKVICIAISKSTVHHIHRRCTFPMGLIEITLVNVYIINKPSAIVVVVVGCCGKVQQRYLVSEMILVPSELPPERMTQILIYFITVSKIQNQTHFFLPNFIQISNETYAQGKFRTVDLRRQATREPYGKGSS